MFKDTSTLSPFAEDVLSGLRAVNKSLSSKYFYDTEGDALFRQIMHMDEYYLTRKELEIFNLKKNEICEAIADESPFRIIELGAGDGLKTKILLKHLIEKEIDFTYTPVDISGNVLDILRRNLKAEMPTLKIEPYQGDYFDALAEIGASPEKDVVFFLGSNVGNFPQEEAEAFLGRLQAFLNVGDQLFMGVDLKKDPSLILSAYNDSQGVTTSFNMNLLKRINRELNANFDTTQFLHYPYYNPQTGECRSYLISKVAQEITISGERVNFRAWESIFMEISKKYDEVQLRHLADKSGFEVKQTFLDDEGWFADVLWEK